MSSTALFVGLQAEPGKEAAVVNFLRRAVPALPGESGAPGGTPTRYALRFDRRSFAIFDTAPADGARLKHLLARVGRPLIAKSFTVLDELPDIGAAEVIAAKPPPAGARPQLALHVPLAARSGHEEEVAALLRGAKAAVDAEPRTLGWFALRLGPLSFAIVDVFPDEAARQIHLAGPVTAALSETGERLFETTPAIRPADVLATRRAA